MLIIVFMLHVGWLKYMFSKKPTNINHDETIWELKAPTEDLA